MAINLQASLSKKLGPLKAWQWGLVLGGGYITYRLLSGKGFSLSGTGSESVSSAIPGESVDYSDGGGGGSSWGGVPEVTVTNIMPTTEKETGDTSNRKRSKVLRDWIEWGNHWKKQAIKNAGTDLNRPKNRTTIAKSKSAGKAGKLRGTQGSHKKVRIPSARRPTDIRSLNIAPKNRPHRKPVSGTHSMKRTG